MEKSMVLEKTYYKDGKIKVEAAYRQGELHGPMIQYGEMGCGRKIVYLQGNHTDRQWHGDL